MKSHTPQCYAAHVGVEWMIEPGWFEAAVSAIRAGTWTAAKFSPKFYDGKDEPVALDLAPYPVTSQGIAIISLDGPMMKARSKFGGTSTVDVRNQLAQATQDPNVSGIMLRIDSPGGTVAGTAELAQAVRDADAVKPVFAQVEDQGASAAYWVGSQARKIYSNELGQVGSIGTVAVLQDLSKAAEMAGIKVHVISTGEYKGAGAPGAPITDAQLAHYQQRIDDMNKHFLNAVKVGRGMGIDAVRKLADGRMHIAAKAAEMGLIDGVQSTEQTMRALLREARAQQRDETAPARRARAVEVERERNS